MTFDNIVRRFEQYFYRSISRSFWSKKVLPVWPMLIINVKSVVYLQPITAKWHIENSKK